MSKEPPPDALTGISESALAGAGNPHLNMHLAEQTASTLWALTSDDAGQLKAITAAMVQLRDIQARDVMEGMLAAQMVASHAAAMECYRRAMLKDQPTQARAMNLSQANKASRTYAALLEALNRHRGKGQQRVTVEHVHVHAGAQAVVGSIDGGMCAKRKEQSHEPPRAIADAPGVEMLGAVEADPEPVQGASRARS